MRLRNRLVAILMGSGLVLGGVALAAPAAHAVTPDCAANGFCGTQVNFGDGLVFDNFQQKQASDNPVIAYSNSNDPGTDFIAFHPTSGPAANTASAKSFEYAPKAHPSGFCMSDPGPGFGAVDRIVLRPCNDSKFQVWVPIASASHSGFFSWRNWASNQFITDNGLRGQLTDVKDGTVGQPDNNQPTDASNQDWMFTQAI